LRRATATKSQNKGVVQLWG